MTSLLDHIRGGRSTTPEPEPVGPFGYTEPDGTVVEYDYDDKIIMRRGDERQNSLAQVFFIPLELLPEFDYHDETITNNNAFWDWMDEFIERNHLKPIRQNRTSRATVKAADWGFGGYGSDKKYLSDWWGGSKYFSDVGSGGAGSEEARKFAIALQAVRSTIRVVDSHERRLSVGLADTDDNYNDPEFSPTSATDFGTRQIVVSACALRDKGLEQGDGIDITTGFALHEASHAEHSEKNLHALDQPTRLAPLQIAGFLYNIAEDVRIEAKTSETFPGFHAYFEKTLSYMWEKFLKDRVPEGYGPGLQEKLNLAVLAVKWPTEYEPIARLDTITSDEFGWWRKWSDDFVSGAVSPRKTLVDALAHLGEDPETQKEMEELAQEETKMGLEKMAIEKALSEALRGMEKGIIQPCSSIAHPHDEGLDAKISDHVRGDVKRMVEEDYDEDRSTMQQIPSSEGRPGSIVVLHPAETDQSRNKYRPPSQAIVQRMKSSFLMRPSAMEWTDRLRKSGSIDDDEIWRAGHNDMRFFEQRNVESAPDTSIAILVDMSGSMSGHKLQEATNAATIIHQCVKDMPGVRVRVYGHTGDCVDSGHGNVVLYKIWERGEPLSRLGILLQRQRADNYDGYAIGAVAREMLKDSRPGEQKLLFVASDGVPAGYGSTAGQSYGGDEAMNHVRDVVNWAARQEVDVIQIAIDDGIREEEQRVMFKHYVAYEGGDKLPAQIMGILKRLM